MVWDTGTFEFAIDDLRPIDDIALYPSDVLPDADINTQMVLLEAARIFDERNRDRTSSARPHPDAASAAAATRRGLDPSGAPRHRRPPPARRLGACAEPERPRVARGDVPKHAAELLRLHVVSARPRLRARSSPRRWQHEVAGVEIGAAGPGRHRASRASRPRSCWSTCGGASVTLEQAASLRRARPRPRSSPWSIRGTAFARRSTRRACWRRCRPRSRRWWPASRTSSRAGATWCAARRGRRPGSGVARLRRVFGDLRSGPDLGHRGAQPDAHHLGVGGARGALPGQARPPGGARRLRHRLPSGRPLAEVDARPQGRRSKAAARSPTASTPARCSASPSTRPSCPSPSARWSAARAPARW